MKTLKKIFSQPAYLATTILVSLLIIAVAAWLPNLHLLTKTMTSETMSLWQKTNLAASLLGSLQTNFTVLSRIVTITSALLAGIQSSLLIYYLRQSAKIQQEMGTSFAGVVSSLLGVGCASCGSVVLTSIFGLGASAAVLTYLPLKGQEFGLIGVIILLAVIYQTVKKINQPYVCVVKEKK